MRRFLILGFLGSALALAIWASLRHWGSAPQPPSVDLTGIDQFERLVVEKSVRRLTAFFGGEPVLVLDVALGFAPIGDKKQEGDGKTPDGIFHITHRSRVNVATIQSAHLARGRNPAVPHPQPVWRV